MLHKRRLALLSFGVPFLHMKEGGSGWTTVVLRIDTGLILCRILGRFRPVFVMYISRKMYTLCGLCPSHRFELVQTGLAYFFLSLTKRHPRIFLPAVRKALKLLVTLRISNLPDVDCCLLGCDAVNYCSKLLTYRLYL
jgi:hypothetical protein